MGQDGGGDQSSYDSNVDDFTAGDHFEIRKYDVSSRVERGNNLRYKYRCSLSTTGTT